MSISPLSAIVSAMVKSSLKISSFIRCVDHTSRHYFSLTSSKFQRLGKDPKDYPDAKGLPHVAVALRMRERGGSAKAGDVIPYIFCLPTGEESEKEKDKMAMRARHPEEIRKANGALQIGDF